MTDHAQTEEQIQTNDAPAGDSDSKSEVPKKRRRRRRGKGGASDEGGGEQQPAAEQQSSDGEGDGGASGGQKPKRRSRGGRKRKKKDSSQAPSADRAPGPAMVDEPTAEEKKAEKKERGGRQANTSDREIFSEKSFDELGLRNSVLKGVHAAGFEQATSIQAQLIPLMLEGKDILGQAKTGSGKTAAFGLPLYHGAQRALEFQSIVLVPTRELAIQITAELEKLGQFTPIRAAAIYGGQAIDAQARKLEEGPEIIVATPGRLMDMVQRRKLHFKNVRVAVLDEVDRMLDIGFRDDIRKILKAMPTERQTIFVSATISDEIESLARSFMTEDAEKIVATSGSLTVSLVEQHYLAVAPWDKRRLLVHLLTHEDPDLSLVFCRTKRTVDNLTKYLRDKKIDAHAIHGDMYQGKRNSVMRRLRGGELSVLVCSDLAARGLDVEGVSHVVNYDLPEDPEVYIHRIGRTARAGRGGVAWALATPEEGKLLTEIEKLANVEIPKMEYPDFKPGPVPDKVREERAAVEKRAEQASKLNRMSTQGPPPKRFAADESKFPGGKVPTKLPPKKLQGKVATARSKRMLGPLLEDEDAS